MFSIPIKKNGLTSLSASTTAWTNSDIIDLVRKRYNGLNMSLALALTSGVSMNIYCRVAGSISATSFAVVTQATGTSLIWATTGGTSVVGSPSYDGKYFVPLVVAPVDGGGVTYQLKTMPAFGISYLGGTVDVDFTANLILS